MGLKGKFVLCAIVALFIHTDIRYRTDSILTFLIICSINTGLLTGAFAVLELVVVCFPVTRVFIETDAMFQSQYAVMPDNLVYLGIYFVFSKRTCIILNLLTDIF